MARLHITPSKYGPNSPENPIAAALSKSMKITGVAIVMNTHSYKRSEIARRRAATALLKVTATSAVKSRPLDTRQTAMTSNSKPDQSDRQDAKKQRHKTAEDQVLDAEGLDTTQITAAGPSENND